MDNNYDFNKQIDEENMDEGDSQLIQNVDRVGTTLKQIMRDWSFEGESERDCYKTILSELMNCYKSVSKKLVSNKSRHKNMCGTIYFLVYK